MTESEASGTVTERSGGGDADEPGPGPGSGGIRAQAMRALSWSMVGTIAMFLSRIASFVVLSRLISPEAFGVIAGATAIGIILKGVGPVSVGQSWMQAAGKTEHLRSGASVAWVIGLAEVVFLVALAGPLSNLFGFGDDAWVLRGWALVCAFQCIAAVPQAALQRDLRFKELTIVQVISMIAGIAVLPIVLAVMGYSVGALFAGVVAQAFLEMAGVGIAHGGIPLPGRWDGTASRTLRTTGAFSSVSVANTSASQVDNLIVGGVLGSAALGFYSRAFRLASLVTNFFADTSNAVIFPVVLRARDDLDRLFKTLAAGLALLSAVTLPLSAVAAVLAPEVIEVMMGRRWLPVTVAFRWLAIGIFPRLGLVPLSATMRGLGRQNTLLKTQWLYVGLVAAGAWIGTNWGIDGVSAGVAVALVIAFLVLSTVTSRVLDGPVSVIWIRLAPGLAIAVLAAGATVLGTQLTADTGNIVRIAVAGSMGTAVAAAGLLLPARRRDLRVFARRGGAAPPDAGSAIAEG